MSDNPPPAYARDYLISAQVAALGYIAPTANIPLNATGEALADLIIANSQENDIFRDAELTDFTNNYRFIGSTSRGPGVAGGDAVAFQNVQTGSIIVGVAGVNDHSVAYKELPQTDIQTALTDGNGVMCADIQTLAREADFLDGTTFRRFNLDSSEFHLTGELRAFSQAAQKRASEMVYSR